MQINQLFSRLWYVHKASSFDSMYTSRDEARERKRVLLAEGATAVTLSYVPVTLGNITRDSKS
jgi:hypothetical protein